MPNKIVQAHRPKTTDEYIIACISASRAIIIAIRYFVPPQRHASIIKAWTIIGLLGSISICIIIDLIDPLIASASVYSIGPFQVNSFWLFVTLFLFLSSRCLEIIFAFYRDAMDKVSKRLKRTNLSRKDRIQLLFLSYLELVVDFALMYFLLQRLGVGAFSESFENISHAIYFSGITITSVGYGDISPKDSLTRYVSVFEAMSGLLMFAVALAVYLGENDEIVNCRCDADDGNRTL